jgi:hypothetical protein
VNKEKVSGSSNNLTVEMPNKDIDNWTGKIATKYEFAFKQDLVAQLT